MKIQLQSYIDQIIIGFQHFGNITLCAINITILLISSTSARHWLRFSFYLLLRNCISANFLVTIVIYSVIVCYHDVIDVIVLLMTSETKSEDTSLFIKLISLDTTGASKWSKSSRWWPQISPTRVQISG